MPSLKLNSATAFFFSSSETSFSLDMPAIPTRAIPIKCDNHSNERRNPRPRLKELAELALE